MDYIKSFYTEDAREQAGLTSPSLSYVIENGKVEYMNKQQYTSDFNDDFNTVDASEFESKFDFYK